MAATSTQLVIDMAKLPYYPLLCSVLSRLRLSLLNGHFVEGILPPQTPPTRPFISIHFYVVAISSNNNTRFCLHQPPPLFLSAADASDDQHPVMCPLSLQFECSTFHS